MMIGSWERTPARKSARMSAVVGWGCDWVMGMLMLSFVLQQIYAIERDLLLSKVILEGKNCGVKGWFKM
jgi:hypothetical protein